MQLLGCLILLTTSAASWAAENSLSASTDVSNEGYFVLNWQTAEADDSLTLEQASSPAFDTVISRDIPAAGALTITGLEDGQYYFRISTGDTALTPSVQVDVEHHSLQRAGSFFLLGLLLFATLTFIILNGNRKAEL